MTITQQDLETIPKTLSEARFERYLVYSRRNKNLALSLYEWNLKLSSSFFVPISIVEVTIRNAIAQTLAKYYRENWHENNGFLRSLPDPPVPNYSPRRNLSQLRDKHGSVGKVIADLNLAFWEGIMTKRHEVEIWNKAIRDSFPNAPTNMSVTDIREKIYNSINNIRKLRNRIAHHEPIFMRNLEDDYNNMYTLTKWRDISTADWMHRMQSVTELIQNKPTMV